MSISPATNADPAAGGAARHPGGSLVSTLLPLVPFLFVLALFIGYFVLLLIYGQALLRFPFDYDQGEGFELYDAIRLARGQGIYLDNAVFPFYSSNYPPVYRLMMVPLVWLFGPHIWVGRAVALACTLIIGVLVFLAARAQMARIGAWPGAGLWRVLDVRLLAPLLAGLAFLAANYVYQIAPLARAHLPMVMFAFAGIYCLDRAFDRAGEANRTYAIAGVALLVVAGFTKLQAVDALAAGFAFLLIRKPRWCALALALAGVGTALAVLVLNTATQGQFWLNVVLANVNEYDIERTWLYYGQWFRLEGALIVCSVLYVLWDVIAALRARSLRPITVWSLYFGAGSAMGMLTGKWGAGPTYLVAAIAASCVCTVGLLWRLANAGSQVSHGEGAAGANRRPALARMALLCALVFFVQATLNVHLPTSGRLFGAVARRIGVAGQSSSPPYPYYDSMGSTLLGHLLDPADVTNGWELVRIIREAPGPVWCEEAMLTLHAGKDVVTNPTQLLNLAKSGMLDTRQMIEQVNAKAFGAVIFRAQFYPQDVLIAIGHNYHWERAVRMNGFDYQVMVPNPD